MTMLADFLPGFKRFFKRIPLADATKRLASSVIVAFLMHIGRMSCLQAAGAVRCDARHRAQISRFLKRPHWRGKDINAMLRQSLLTMETGSGPFLFAIDATLCAHAGQKTENTYSTGNRKRRPQKSRRYSKYKYTQKSCHSFTMGLLITPSGMRIPFSKPYHTREYCKEKGWAHRTTAEAAADLIRELPLPEGAEVIVLGDTAYDAEVVREACADLLFIHNSITFLGRRPATRSRSRSCGGVRPTEVAVPTVPRWCGYCSRQVALIAA